MVDKKSYIKWYRLARSTLNDDSLVPERTDEQIVSLVSNADWLRFEEDARTHPRPNVYFELSGNGKAKIGLSFNKVSSIDHFNNIIKPHSAMQKQQLLQKLAELEDYWQTDILIKTKQKTHSAKPSFKTAKKIQTNQITENKFIEISDMLQTIREEGKPKCTLKPEYFWEGPSLDLMVSEFDLSEDEFVKRIKKIFEVLEICRGIITEEQANREEKRKKRLAEEKEDKFW